MKRIIQRFFKKTGIKKPARDLIHPGPNIAQVEVTTRCNLKCRMCPRTHFSGEKHLDFPWEVFQRFSVFFPRMDLVYLQGWGEPLMHPRFFDMVALVRQNDCQAGFTTNGSFLNETAIGEILRLSVKYVTISLAGADPHTHDTIRAGSHFDALLGSVSNLVEAKRREGRETPQIHLSYLITRDSVAGLPDMVRKAHEIGVDRLIAPNLDSPATKEEDDHRIFGFEEPSRDFQKALDDAQIVANKLKFRLSVWPLKLSSDILICELNPLRQFFVNVHGDVTPCTYSSVMGRNDYCRYFSGAEVPSSPLIFGSLEQDEMEVIWNREEYRRFRRYYQNRLQQHNQVSLNRTSIHSIFGLNDYLRDIDKALSENPPPEFCRKCYKAYGA